MSDFEKEVTLQAQEIREGTTQFKVTLPFEFVELMGWRKGDVLNVKTILGQALMIEKKEEV